MNAKNRSVTRADVARLSGVSTAVVSYVLNDGPKPVSAPTRERVLEAVRALGYRPNAAARALSRGTADMIGVVVVDNRNPFFAQLLHALDRASIQRSRSLLTVNGDPDRKSTVAQVQDLIARQVGGVIVADIVSDAEQRSIASMGVPALLINQYPGTAGVLPAIGVDFRAGTKHAVDHLLAHDYSEIAFVGGALAADPRERGWSDALRDAGLPLGRSIHSPFSYDGGIHAGRALVAEGRPPRAVFAASDQIAIGLIAALSDANLRVPDDVAVASFDGIDESNYVRPALTTIKQPIADMAISAIDHILSARVSQSFTTFPTDLEIRQSCGCHRDR